MRILVVSQYFWPETFRINDLVTELVCRGHDVRVLTGNPNYPSGVFLEGYGGLLPRRDCWEGISVLRVPHLARGTGGGAHLAANYLTFALSAALFGPLLARRNKPEVILVHQPSPLSVAVPGLLLSRIMRVPAALWVQDLWPDTLLAVGPVRRGLAYSLIHRASAAIHRRFDVVLVQSDAFVAPLVGQGVAKHRIRYLPNWAESVYRPVSVAPDAPEASEFPAGFCVLFAGNIGVSQSFETALESAEQLRDLGDLHWVVIGDGRQAGWLADQVDARGLSGQFHLLGRRPMDTMPAYYALADALFVSLKAEPVYEMTIPSKIQSYLASGRPIVASLNGEGARVATESGAAMVAPAQDARALASSVRRLHAMSSEARDAMGRRGRAYYEQHFDREVVIARAETYLAEMRHGRAS